MKSTETRDTEVHFKRQQGQKRKQIKKIPKNIGKNHTNEVVIKTTALEKSGRKINAETTSIFPSSSSFTKSRNK